MARKSRIIISSVGTKVFLQEKEKSRFLYTHPPVIYVIGTPTSSIKQAMKSQLLLYNKKTEPPQFVQTVQIEAVQHLEGFFYRGFFQSKAGKDTIRYHKYVLLCPKNYRSELKCVYTGAFYVPYVSLVPYTEICSLTIVKTDVVGNQLQRGTAPLCIIQHRKDEHFP